MFSVHPFLSLLVFLYSLLGRYPTIPERFSNHVIIWAVQILLLSMSAILTNPRFLVALRYSLSFQFFLCRQDGLQSRPFLYFCDGLPRFVGPRSLCSLLSAPPLWAHLRLLIRYHCRAHCYASQWATIEDRFVARLSCPGCPSFLF